MAQMFPKYMRPYEKSSKENLMFQALESLDDNYFVLHSVNFDYFGKRQSDDVFQAFHQHQADFIIFHKDKGILVIEGKAGEIRFENGTCIQINGKDRTEHTITPYQQASNIKFDIFNTFDKEQINGLKKYCKFQHAVWFADLTKTDFIKQASGLDMNLYRTLTFDDIEDTEILAKDIDKIFSLPDEFEEEIYHKKKDENPNYAKMTDSEYFKLVYKNPTKLSEDDFEKIIDKIFNPMLILAGSESTNIKSEDMRLDYLLHEQKLILNYLEEQHSAIINGAAGTGKTHIACEKALRHSRNGENVLFLCYNRRLCKQLKNLYENNSDMENVDFYTLDKLSYKYCKKIDYDELAHTISNMYDKFPYKHVIIDEGQDFGAKFNEKVYDSSICNVIQALQDTVMIDDLNPGTFYLFYDKNQMVQCKNIPQYILDADCKLTLYTNCRNTANIAKTSSKIISNKNKVLNNNIKSKKPIMYNSEDEQKQIINLEMILQQCIDNKIEESQVEILTVKTIESSILSKSDKLKQVTEEDYENYNNDYEKKYEYKYCYKGKEFDFTTCRKYKGLEAKVIILIDITPNIFNGTMNRSIIYVGATRAKNRLYMISNISPDGWERIADDLNLNYAKPKTPFVAVKNYLDVDIKKE